MIFFFFNNITTQPYPDIVYSTDNIKISKSWDEQTALSQDEELIFFFSFTLWLEILNIWFTITLSGLSLSYGAMEASLFVFLFMVLKYQSHVVD